MSTNWRVGLLGIGALTGVVCLASTAWGGGFAAAGTSGVLNIEVKVTGGGRVDGKGAGFDYLTYEVGNRASLRVNMEAGEPMVDPDRAAALQNPAAGGEDDEDWENAWNDKLDACDGDEDCEMQVEMQRMQDPRFQAMISGAMQMMAEVDPSDLAPSIQPWSFLLGAVGGQVKVHFKMDVYGISDGMEKGDLHCVTDGEEALVERPSGYGDRGLVLNIDSKSSSYQLTLPADVVIDADDTCNPDRRSSVRVLGPSPDGGWDQTLTVNGQYTGGSERPSFSGNKRWTGVWDAHGNRPVDIAISWCFAPAPTGSKGCTPPAV